MFLLQRQKTYTRLRSFIYQKEAIIIITKWLSDGSSWPEFDAGMFKTAVGTAPLTCQDHLQARQPCSLSQSFHCVLLTALLWKISGTVQLQKQIPDKTPATRGGTGVLTVYNANIIAR
jgi:hypothetical protein